MVGVMQSNSGMLIHGTFLPPLPSLQQPVHYNSRSLRRTVVVALKSRKGFGPPPSSPSKSSTPPTKSSSAEEQLQQQKKKDPNDEDDEIPEMVTDRMLKRIGFAVGIPLSLGVLFFPFFWYLKVVLKVDVPEWLPLLVSGLFFGTSGLGITYGIVSTSWDPLREGSVLGWKEAQANWPVFFQNLQGKKARK